MTGRWPGGRAPASRSRTRSCPINCKKIDDSRDLPRTIADLPAKSDGRRQGLAQQGEQTIKVKLGTLPDQRRKLPKAETPSRTSRRGSGGNVDLKQLGLTREAGRRRQQGRRRHLRRRSELGRRPEGPQGGRHHPRRPATRTLTSPQDVAKAVKKAQDDGALRRHVPHQEGRRPDGSRGRAAQEGLNRLRTSGKHTGGPFLVESAGRLDVSASRGAQCESSARSSHERQRSGDEMRVLVIEDDRETAQFLQKALKESGHAADLAEDGETGLALAERRRLRRADRRPHAAAPRRPVHDQASCAARACARPC